jgi:hypothetical protein
MSSASSAPLPDPRSRDVRLIDGGTRWECTRCHVSADRFALLAHSAGCSVPLEVERARAWSLAPLAVRLYGLLRRHCDATGVNWYAPQEVLRDLQREIEKELDPETRRQMALLGIESRQLCADLSTEDDPPWMRDPEE